MASQSAMPTFSSRAAISYYLSSLSFPERRDLQEDVTSVKDRSPMLIFPVSWPSSCKRGAEGTRSRHRNRNDELKTRCMTSIESAHARSVGRQVPDSIDDVIERLDAIIAQSRKRESRLGYFAVLYRNVTVRVKEGIERGRFEDGERMARLDVTFANRYFEAYHLYADGARPSRSWAVAFEAAGRWRPIVLQHLLTGMNAHINLDLSVAAARTCPGPALAELERDFREINAILLEMLDDVQDCLSRISPWGRIFDLAGGRLDEFVARMGLTGTRDWAWMSALHLAALEPEEQAPVIERIDRRIAEVGGTLLNPGAWLAFKLLIVRLSERRDVGEVTDLLTL